MTPPRYDDDPVRANEATETSHVRDACNSLQNADGSIVPMRLVRVTHPFHPLSGQELPCVGERFNRSGKRLLLQVNEAVICSVPPSWTDLLAPDPEVMIGERRALFRVADLIALAQLVDRLGRRAAMEASDDM
jgi:hypothetical protein